MIACANRNSEMAEIFLHEADIESADAMGWRALHHASKAGVNVKSFAFFVILYFCISALP